MSSFWLRHEVAVLRQVSPRRLDWADRAALMH
jgi:hypothetical protein